MTSDDQLATTENSHELVGRMRNLFSFLVWCIKRAIVATILFVVVLNIWCWIDPADPLVLSNDTTFIDAPIAEDGLPDYTAAMLDALGRGTSSEINGAIPFWQALGVEDIPLGYRDEFLNHLGMTPPQSNTLSAADLDSLEELIRNGLGGQETESSTLDDAVQEVFLALHKRTEVVAKLPAVSQWLGGRTTALDKLTEVVNRPRFYSPPPNLLSKPSPPLFEMLCPDLQASRRAVRALLIRSSARAESGAFDEALSDIQVAVAITDRMSQKPIIISQAVAAAELSLAFEAIRRWINECESLQRGRVLLAWLRKTDTDLNLEETFAFGERLAMTDYVIRGLFPTRYHPELDLSEQLSTLETNVLLQEVQAWLRRQASLAEEGGRVERARLAEAFDADLAELVSQMSASPAWLLARSALSRDYRSRLLARIQIALLMPAQTAIFEVETRSSAQCSMTLLAAALRLHRLTSGAYPPSLDILTPSILDSLPLDPFTNQPFRYERRGDGFLLYSLGPNGVDDGASDRTGEFVEGEYAPVDWFGEREEPDGPDDIVVRLPVPELEVPHFGEE